ncbi:hypothetical protein CAEBREN_29707 [Caenorhabditis brenneri]|uniref:Serpentine receptor class gamma n=1 Tax=Caenorhabditis brenneri TaxID=135651 RepID=G0NEK8_CAEBE|nr:hypothetical protein CAEBREN_29707 [Caenorhabditis brenneri]
MVQDWSLTILIVPILNFPSMSGYGMGLLTWLNVPQIYQNYLLMTMSFVMCVAIVHIFENRFYQLFALQTIWSKFRIPFIIINYTLSFSINMPIALAVPQDQKTELVNVFLVSSHDYSIRPIIVFRGFPT